MPNTLAHIGVQGLLHRSLVPRLDLRWALVGCVLPDVPWIVQRLVVTFLPEINRLDLRLYAMVQASLALCLFLAAALALCSSRPSAAFTLMAGNSMLHLLLDACETKWANGVHLLAPLSWQLTSIGLCWPESLCITLLTLLGCVVVFRQGKGFLAQPALFKAPSWPAAAGMGLLAAAYLLLPLLWLSAAERSNSHFVATLRQVEERVGRPIAFDRCHFDPTHQTVRVFSGELLAVRGIDLSESGTISLRGQFLSADTVEVLAWHRHWSWSRDAAAILGLLAVLAASVGPRRLRGRGDGGTAAGDVPPAPISAST